jgi:hypothetical protein
MTVRRSLTWLVPLALLVAGCGDSTDRGGALGDRVTCDGEYTFDPADLAQGASGIVSDSEVREALRVLYDESDMGDELGPGPFENGTDAVAYRVLGQDGDAIMLAIGRWPAEGPGRMGLYLAMQRDGETWAYLQGGRCQLRPVLVGDHASWVEMSPLGSLDHSSRTVRVGVVEQACTGGRKPGPYLDEPRVRTLGDKVVVYWTSTVEGSGTCVGPMPQPATLTLPRPLGDRDLYDGSVYPPRLVG